MLLLFRLVLHPVVRLFGDGRARAEPVARPQLDRRRRLAGQSADDIGGQGQLGLLQVVLAVKRVYLQRATPQ